MNPTPASRESCKKFIVGPPIHHPHGIVPFLMEPAFSPEPPAPAVGGMWQKLPANP